MGLTRAQQVSGLLHELADLVQAADSYLSESSLAPTPFSKASQKRGRPRLTATPFNRSNKKDEKGKRLFSAIKRPALRKPGLQPHKADGITNRLRRSSEGLKMLDRNVFRAKRERKERSRHHSKKNLLVKPQKIMGSWVRKR